MAEQPQQAGAASQLGDTSAVDALIDNLDAQTDAFRRVIEETTGKRQEWSDYIALINRQIWTKNA